MPGLSVLYFLIIAFGFGSAFALVNVAVASLSPIWVATARASIAALVALGFIAATGRRIRTDRRHLALYVGLGFSNVVLPFITLSWGQRMIDSGLAGVLFASITLFTVLLTPLLLPGERIRSLQLAGSLVGLVGVAVATMGDALDLSPAAARAGAAAPLIESLDPLALFGAGLTLFAALCYAIGSLVVRRVAEVDALALAAGQLVAGAAMLIATAFAFDGAPQAAFGAMPAHGLAALVALGALCTAAPMISVFLLIRREGPARASLSAFAMPFMAVLIGSAFLAEPLTLSLLLGFVLVLGGAWMVIRG